MISSLQNEKIKEYSKLKQKKYRDLTNLFLIEGLHLLEEAFKKGIVKEIFSSDLNFEYQNQKITYVSQHVLEKLSQTISPQKIVAVCEKKVNNFLGNKIIALDNIQDAGNLGTIMRNSLAFGFDTIIFTGVDPYNEKVIRASQGALFHLNIINPKNLEELLISLRKEYFIYGTILDVKAKEISKINFNKEKMIIIFGNEGKGISSEIQKLLNEKIYIDIEFESLNVASANAIVLYNVKKGQKC